MKNISNQQLFEYESFLLQKTYEVYLIGEIFCLK